ncbi:MAG: thiopurine S-methyltransferase [Gammaproteobacteria bacterium]|nr:MAG: thiopurine S-methyltransferase [Gammaproteobacteria bacterium]
MEPEFWHQRWQENQIGFHQDRVNETLEHCFPLLTPRPGEHVFVPLCGKSLDMLWLQEQGHPVTGVELSPLAVEGFFRENGLRYRSLRSGDLSRHDATGFTLYCGDFFDLQPVDVHSCTLVYDRAALVAFPPEMRPRYAAHLLGLLPAGARILLVTLAYPGGEMEGPPFSVEEEEVRSLFDGCSTVRALRSRDVLESEPKLRARGLSALREEAWLIRP